MKRILCLHYYCHRLFVHYTFCLFARVKYASHILIFFQVQNDHGFQTKYNENHHDDDVQMYSRLQKDYNTFSSMGF